MNKHPERGMKLAAVAAAALGLLAAFVLLTAGIIVLKKFGF